MLDGACEEDKLDVLKRISNPDYPDMVEWHAELTKAIFYHLNMRKVCFVFCA